MKCKKNKNSISLGVLLALALSFGSASTLTGCLAGGSVAGAEESNVDPNSSDDDDGGTTTPDTTDTPTVASTSPASPAANGSPAIVGTAEANASVEIFTDSSCSTSAGTGTADGSGNYSISVSQEGGSNSVTYYAQATATGETVSACSSTNVSFINTSIATGLGVFYGTQTNAPSSATEINQGTAYSLQFSSSEFDSSYFSHSTSTNSHEITVQQAGDYFISFTIPMEMPSGTYRPAVRAEVFVNDVAVTGAVGQSTYIRFDGGQEESSAHLAMLLRGLSASDVVEVMLSESAGEDGSEVVNINTQAQVFMEFVSTSRNIFTATATQTTNGTNLNDSTAYSLEWTEDREDSAFTHDDGTNPEEVTLSDAGAYLVYFNMPITSTGTRPSPQAVIRLNGVAVDGGRANQGYIRGDSGHNDSSVHWSAVLPNVSANDVLTIQTQLVSETGTVTMQTSNSATLMIEKLSSTSNLISLRGNTLSGGNDWNPAAAENILWSISDFADTDAYTHSTATNNHQITVTQPGDYVLFYNDALSTAIERANPLIQVQVNGVDVNGAQTKTHYMRNNSAHDSSSANLTYLLRGLSASDVVTVTIFQEGNTGAVDDDEDALFGLYRK